MTTTTEPTSTEAASTEAIDAAGTGPLPEGVDLVHVDPTTLLVDRNIREVRLTRSFVASVKAHGVIQPVVAVRTADAARLRVRTGHRRTLAAIEAGVATVPVYIAGAEGGAGEEAARIVEQWTENEHRAALTTAERATTVEQLTLLGLSAGQIVHRTKTSKTDVAAALAVAGSEVARAAADRYDFLTLEQSAALAEFDQPETTDEAGVVHGGRDDEAITALVAAAQEGPVQFARALHAAREVAAERRGREQVAGPLRAAGVTVLEREPHWSDTTVSLEGLYDPADPAGEPLTAETHAQCPGHVAWLLSEWVRRDGADPDDPDDLGPSDADEDDGWVQVYRAVLGCTDPVTHGHADRCALASGRSRDAQPTDPADAEAEREAKRKERREVITNNKAMDAAAPIRREWVRALLARKTAPKGTAAFLAAAMANGHADAASASVPSQVAALFGQPDGVHFDVRKAAELATDATTEARALVIALGIALAGYEARMDRSTWRSHWAPHRAYLLFLEANGYPLSDVEVLASGRKPKRVQRGTTKARARRAASTTDTVTAARAEPDETDAATNDHEASDEPDEHPGPHERAAWPPATRLSEPGRPSPGLRTG